MWGGIKLVSCNSITTKEGEEEHLSNLLLRKTSSTAENEARKSKLPEADLACVDERSHATT